MSSPIKSDSCLCHTGNLNRRRGLGRHATGLLRDHGVEALYECGKGWAALGCHEIDECKCLPAAFNHPFQCSTKVFKLFLRFDCEEQIVDLLQFRKEGTQGSPTFLADCESRDPHIALIVMLVDVSLSGKFFGLGGDKRSTHMKILSNPADTYAGGTLKFCHCHHEVVLRTRKADPRAEITPNLLQAVGNGKEVIKEFSEGVV